MNRLRRPFTFVADHSRLVIALLLVASLVAGAGLSSLDTGTQFQTYRGESPEATALEYVEANFSTARENATVAQIVIRDDNAIDRETLLSSLRLQRAIRENETVAPVLADERPTVGLANVVARTAVHRRAPNVTASLDVQIDALAAARDAQVRRVVTTILDGDPGRRQALGFVPNSYEPGSATANATILAVFQSASGESVQGQAPDALVAAQTTMQSIAEAQITDGETFVVGNGIITAEQERARQDSMQLVGPLALLFVLVTLAVAYRDVVDVLLGLVGIGLVLVWTFGALGWLGIPFSSLYVAIPVLLIGLSIDYAIHVFMRYREERDAGAHGPRSAMRRALPSVGVALVWVTLTTAIGFLSNLAGPIGPLADIGVISAIGIVSALVVFGGVIPAVKLELDRFAEHIGFDRMSRPLGTGESRFRSALSIGARAATTAPLTLLLAALLVTAGAAVAATDVSTSFEPQDFMPGETPDWMSELPADVQPGDYEAKANLAYTSRHFATQDAQAEVLIRDDVTDPAVLERLATARDAAGRQDTVQVLASGNPRTRSPLGVMRRVAARNDNVASTLAAADTDGDGSPDRDIAAVYDALFASAPAEAGQVLQRENGDYTAARLTIGVREGASSQMIRDDVREIAATIEGPSVTATATGEPVVRAIVQDELLASLLTSLLVTLLFVLAVLALGYRLTYGSATLGVVTLVPVGMTVVWIIATMAILGIALSVLTVLVASLTIGIGVDYAIHLSGRYVEELQRGNAPAVAVFEAVVGTGSALFGSAVTTMGGFGVLALATLPTLRQFGIVTAVTIGYAFVASVIVLPSLLVVWSRYVGVVTGTSPQPSSGPEIVTGDD